MCNKENIFSLSYNEKLQLLAIPSFLLLTTIVCVLTTEVPLQLPSQGYWWQYIPNHESTRHHFACVCLLVTTHLQSTSTISAAVSSPDVSAIDCRDMSFSFINSTQFNYGMYQSPITIPNVDQLQYYTASRTPITSQPRPGSQSQRIPIPRDQVPDYLKEQQHPNAAEFYIEAPQESVQIIPHRAPQYLGPPIQPSKKQKSYPSSSQQQSNKPHPSCAQQSNLTQPPSAQQQSQFP